MTTFPLQVCQHLPLAEATLRLLDFVTDDDWLAPFFEQHRGASYEKLIGFPLFVHLIADALLEHDGSGHQSFRRAQEDGSLPTSLKAIYGKLARLPLPLSRAFLAEATDRLQAVTLPGSAALPASLRALRVLALDGKKVKHVLKRLKVLRPFKGHVYGGKLVVAQDVSTGLAHALDASPDGEASDAPLVPAVLQQVRARLPGPRLWLADRQYCDLNQPRQLAAQGDHYVIRYNAKVGFHADPDRPARSGTEAQGRAFREEWGWLGAAGDPRRQYVRRITLVRPDAEDVILVTDLLDGERYPAADLLAVYLLRWGIENLFQRVTEVFHLQHLIGSTPQATVFQASFCLLLSNLVTVVRAYIAAAQARPAEAVSLENLFDDVHRQLVAWNELLTPAQTLAVLRGDLSAAAVSARLRALLGSVWSARWLKAPPKKRRSEEARPRKYIPGGHTSVYRILMAARNAKKKVHRVSLK